MFCSVLLIGFLPVRAQGLPFMRNYEPSEYNAHNQNFDILVDKEEGVVYVANFEGLLYFDNAEWDILHTPGISRITTLFQDSMGKIWTGGYNFIGYLEYNDVIDAKLHPLENLSGIRGEVNEIWEENESFPEVLKFHLEAEYCGQVQGQEDLDDRSHHIVEGKEQRPDDIVSLEDLTVVAQSHELPCADILHIIEAELYHFQKREIREENKETDRNQ